MPIRFEQQAPAQQYGAAMGQGQQYAMQQQAAMEWNRQQAQVQMNNADNTARSGAADGDNANRRQMFEETRQDRGAEQQAEAVNRLNLVEQRGGIEARQNVQQAELRAWVGQQDITQQEVARLERMKQGVASVQAMVQSKKITPEDGDAMIGQLKTGINYLDVKKQRTEEKFKETQTKNLVASAELNSRLTSADKNVQAEAIRQTVVNIPDPDNPGKFVTGTFNPNSHVFQPVKPEKAEKGVDTGKIEAAARKEFLDQWNHVEKQVRDEARMMEADKKTPLHPQLQSQESRELNVRERMLKNPSFGEQDIETYVKKRVGGAGQKAAPGGNVSTPQAGEPADKPQFGKPFKPGDTENMDAQQIRQVSKLEGAMKYIEGLPSLPPEKKADLVGTVHALHDMIAQYGDLTRPDLPEAAKKRAAELRKKLEEVPSMPYSTPAGNPGVGASESAVPTARFRAGIGPFGR